MRPFSIVVAADQASGIGLNGGLPWRLRKDMAFFAKVTSKVPNASQNDDGIQKVNACIMGRRTWESIPAKFRPLGNRLNIVVSRDPRYLDDKPEKNNPMVALATSFESALDLVESYQQLRPEISVERVFLIGGGQLYTEGIQSKACQHIFLTRIHATVECDAFFPDIKESEYSLLSSDQAHSFLEDYMQESVEGGTVVEGTHQYEYTVYSRI
ncbi:hypothetical protein BGX28_001474 [Mortierella sp. GBA30]|nr:hypothetical protein BGX28_001474 [Mortierella sp. GBA30]